MNFTKKVDYQQMKGFILPARKPKTPITDSLEHKHLNRGHTTK